ncbi:SAM-dependent methyltransferase, partial [Aquimarina celericrescens]|nr:SAM-dependent methyltransferase [Aquimarina celericrescens]
DNYYGQMTYKISYKKSISDSFQWLYLDFNLLNKKASKRGFLCELVFEDEHFGFLAKLKLN